MNIWSIIPRNCTIEYDPLEYESREFVKEHSSYWEVRETESKYMIKFHVQKKLSDNVYMFIFGSFTNGQEDKPVLNDVWFFREPENFNNMWGLCSPDNIDTKSFEEMLNHMSIDLQKQILSNWPKFLWYIYHDVRKNFLL
jgi:hypothetical protein